MFYDPYLMNSKTQKINYLACNGKGWIKTN